MGTRLGTPAATASTGLHGRRKFAAGQCHRLKYLFQSEFGLPIRTLARLLAVEGVLLFVSSGTVFMIHKKFSGPCSFSPNRLGWRGAKKSVREVYNRVPDICQRSQVQQIRGTCPSKI